MEQVAIQPFLQGLATMDKVPVQYTSSALDAIQRGRESQELVLDDLVRQKQQSALTDPLKVQRMQLENNGLGIGNQQQGYTLQDMIRKDQMAKYTFDARQEAELQKLLTEAGSERSKRFEQELFDQIQKVPPGSPEHQRLVAAARSTRSFLMEQAKHEHAMEIARIQAASREKVESMGINAGKYDRNRALSFEDAFRKMKKAHERHQALIDEAQVARLGGDFAKYTEYMQRAEALRPQAIAELDALRRGQEGNVDIGRMTDLPTRTAPGIAPPAVPVAPAPAQKPSAAPTSNKPDPTVSGGGTRVRIVGPDGKRYTVPKEQLQDAIKQGYKEAP